MTIWIYTGGRPSNGAKTLASLNGFRRCLQGRGIKRRDVLVNWGFGGDFELARNPAKVINGPKAVATASNKLYSFSAFENAGLATVSFTTDYQEAMRWMQQGGVVVVRNKLTGHSGDGIVIIDKAWKEANPGKALPKAPLYTLYVFKQQEYRVHVCNGRVIDTQQKIRDPAREPLSWKVRSHANGFIFARDNVVPSNERDLLAIAAIRALGLDFGAVDIIHNKEGDPLLLEVNTAPGLEGQTIQSYERALRGFEG